MNDVTKADLATRARRAVAEAEVGAGELYEGLNDLRAVEVDVAGSTLLAVVSLPVPDAGLRDCLESALRRTLGDVDGASAVAVEWQPAVADPGSRVDILPDVKNVIAVASGKGGVGKSTIAANLAVSLADAGASVGLLDADIYGPNAPALLGLDDRAPTTTADARIVPREAHGVQVMSLAFVVGEDDPVIWRGPMVDDVLQQLTRDVEWGTLDYLVVDLPPGTGDAQLTLVQHLPVAGVVVVTTPQPVAVDDARRGLKGFAKYGVPVLGIVENMSWFECPDCEGVHDVFGSGGADSLAEEFEIPVIGRLPLDPAMGTLTGEPTRRGVELPVLGRVGLPRMQDKRTGRLPPIAIRDGGRTRERVRRAATRVAARVEAAAAADSDANSSP